MPAAKLKPHSSAVPSAPAPDRLLTEVEVAERLKWSRKTLQRRRWLRLEPAWCKIGSSVRYSERVVERFIEDGRHLVDDLGIVRSPAPRKRVSGRQAEAA
jgi:hypothetical protein